MNPDPEALRPYTLRYFDDESQIPADPTIPWTASRCLRLLRPLSTKIGLVKRTWNQDSQAAEGGSERGDKRLGTGGSGRNDEWPSNHGAISKRKIRTKYSSKRKLDSNGHSGGNASKRQKSTEERAPGELSLPTPFLSRHFGPRRTAESRGANGSVGSSPSTSHICNLGYEWANKRTKLAAAQKRASASVIGGVKDDLKCYQTDLNIRLGKDLHSLLCATNPKREGRDAPIARGASSLLSMCLRKVPTVIREEQEYVDTLGLDERYDVSTQVYTELEECYSTSSNGWKPLRQLVRAHGIDILCDGIRKNYLDRNVVRSLRYACFENDADFEFRALFSCVLRTNGSPVWRPYGCVDRFSKPRGYLPSRLLSGIAHERELVYQELNYLFGEAFVHMQWSVLQDVVSPLQMAVEELAWRDLSGRNGRLADALQLVETILLRSINITALSLTQDIYSLRSRNEKMAISTVPERSQDFRPPNKYCMDQWPSLVQNTTSSLMTITVAMELLRLSSDHAIRTSCVEPYVYITPRLSLAIQQYRQLCSYSSLEGQSPLSALETSQALLGHLFLLNYNDGPHPEIEVPGVTHQALLETFEELLHTSVDKDDLSQALTSFVCSISRFCGRAHRENGFDYLKTFVATLTNPGTSQPSTYPNALSLLRTVAVEASMAFAEQSGWKEHFDWVAQVQQQSHFPSYSVKVHEIDTQAPCRDIDTMNNRKSFRWEDSISEWVAKTPAKSLYQPLCCQFLPESDPDTESSNPEDTDPETLFLRIQDEDDMLPGEHEKERKRVRAQMDERKMIRRAIRERKFEKGFRGAHRKVRDTVFEQIDDACFSHDEKDQLVITDPEPNLKVVEPENAKGLRAHWQPKGAMVADDNGEEDELSLDYDDITVSEARGCREKWRELRRELGLGRKSLEGREMEESSEDELSL